MAERRYFEETVLPFATPLYRAALAMTRNAQQAEDLTQTTILKALERFDSFQEGSNCKAWLFRILHNTWVDQLRHRKVVGPEVQIEESLVSEPDGQEETAWSNPRDLLENFGDEQVIEALLELPEDQRLTLYLTDVENLPQDQIAEVLGVAVGTIKSRASRARSQLRDKLQSHADDLGFTGRRA
ncbi:MAG: sigma-70 family RNA polymerase sigma factor [Planctomycetota bacterium]